MSNIGIGGLNNCERELTNTPWNVFSPEEVESDIRFAQNLRVRPVASTTSAGPFKFMFVSDPEKWTDIRQVILNGKVRIKKIDNGAVCNLTATDNCSVVNNFYHSLC